MAFPLSDEKHHGVTAMKPPPFEIGQRVECIRSASQVGGCRGKLVKGEIYTVSAIIRDGWLNCIDLVELPCRGTAPYAASRFIPAKLAADIGAEQ